MSDSEDDTPLVHRIAKLQPSVSSSVCQEVELPAYMRPVEGEGQELNGQAWVDRAYEFRHRAEAIFKAEVEAVLENPRVSKSQKESLLNFSFHFDKGTTRRGVCKYPRVPGGKGYICLSAKMVDCGASAEKIQKVIRHEISHACTPGCKHNQTWKNFDIMIGGDGKRCCSDKEVKEIIGHRVEVYCSLAGPVEGTGHYFAKMQKAPSAKKMTSKCCGKCKKEDGIVSYLRYRRV